jgi:polyhydroxyalkanoate synthesis repressor PhaR
MASSSPDVVSIKRYPNRRLYDRQARRYITLQDLEDLVLQGKKIEVRDSRSGDDLTRAILTQILLERHPEKMEMFPVAMLHGILQANDLVLEFLRTYLRQSLAILEQMQQPPPLAPFLAPMDWMRAMIPPNFAFPMSRPPQEPAGPSPRAEMDARIAEIEERIRRLEQPADPSSRTVPGHPADRTRPAAEHSAALERLEKRLSGLERGVGEVEERAS